MVVHAGYNGGCDARDERLVTEILAGVDVGEVDFHGLQTGCDHGVAQGHAGVGETAGVEDETGEPGIAPFVNLVNEHSLVVGLEGVDFAFAGCCFGFYLFLDLVECDGTVNLGFAFAQAVEVGAVEESNLLHLALN